MHSFATQQLVRPGVSGLRTTKAARVSVDFVVSGKSLLLQLVEADDGHYYSLSQVADAFMGCFVNGFESENLNKRTQLVKATEPDTEEGRYLLYTCPECGDIGCGAYAAKIRLTEGTAEWYDFAYENGYEPCRVLSQVGPFLFSRIEYESIIGSASAV